MTEKTRAKDDDRDMRKSMNKSTMNRSHVYRQDLDKTETTLSPSSSFPKTSNLQSQVLHKTGSGNLDPIVVPHKEFNASRDIASSKEIKNQEKKSNVRQLLSL